MVILYVLLVPKHNKETKTTKSILAFTPWVFNNHFYKSMVSIEIVESIGSIECFRSIESVEFVAIELVESEGFTGFTT